MTSLKDILERIADIERGITGIKRVFDGIPRQIERADFPCMVNFPKAVIEQHIGATHVTESRQFELYLFYAPALQGTELQNYDALLEDELIDAISSEFHARRTLQLNDMGIVERAALLGDGGIVPIVYPTEGGTVYLGVVFRLVVDRSYFVPAKYGENVP